MTQCHNSVNHKQRTNVLKLACENAFFWIIFTFLNGTVKHFLANIKPLVCCKMCSKMFGNRTTNKTSSPKGNDRSPKSNVPRSNLISKKKYKWAMKTRGPKSNSTKLDQNQPRKGGDTIFPILSQWRLSVAMDTKSFIQSASKHYAALPHPQ